MSRANASPKLLHLQLYVAGSSPNSVAALRHLRAALAAHPELNPTLEIIDVLGRPELGLRHHVLVTPTLVKVAPAPQRRVIGSLRNTSALLSVLGVDDPVP